MTGCQATSSFCRSRRSNQYGGLPFGIARPLHHWDLTKSLAFSLSFTTVTILWQSISLSATVNTAAITSQMSARLTESTRYDSRSQWPCDLRRRSSAARLLRSWVRIPPGTWMFVCCECCVLLSGRGFYEGMITRPEESYRLWPVVVCDQETSKTRRLKPATGLWKIQPQWVVKPGKQATNNNKHGTIPRKLDIEQEAQTRNETSRTVCVVTHIIQVMRFREQSPSWDAYSLSAHVPLRHFRNTKVH